MSTEMIANPPSTCGGAVIIENARYTDSSVVYSPSRDLDLEGSTRFRHAIASILKPGVNLVLNLSNVERIEAIGASAVVGSIRRVRAAGGTVRICNANPRVAWYLKLVGADRLTMANPAGRRRASGAPRSACSVQMTGTRGGRGPHTAPDATRAL
jgi:anti-anti-sigma factor